MLVSLLLLIGGATQAQALTLAPFKSLYAFPDSPTAMSGPAAVVVAPDGDIIYADAGTTGDNAGGGFHRIRILSATGQLKASWGTKGSAPGKFRAPQALALGPNNLVYVADTYNSRVQVFERDGTFVRAWGTAGAANGQMREPRGIAVDKNGNVYVSDSGNSRVEVFSSTGSFLEAWTSSAAEPFDTPTGIVVAADLRVYVTDLNKHNVKQFSAGPTRTLLNTWGWTTGQTTNTSRYSFPRTITLSPDGTSLIIADTGNCRIERCSFTGLSLETTGSIPGSSTVGKFDQPRGAALAADGKLVVADTRNGRIQRSAPTSSWATPWATPWLTASALPGLLSAPEAVAADPTSGVTYVADSANSRVLRYAANGTYLGVFAPSGAGIGEVMNPKGLLVLDDGTVVVADTGNSRIQVFNPDGAYVRSIGTGQLSAPRGMALSVLGAFFVADAGNSRVARFDWSTGLYVAQVGTLGSGAGQLNAPQGVALYGTNVLWIADTGNNRVQKYNVGTVVAQPQTLLGAEGGPAGDLLKRPSAVLMEGSDLVVADTNNNRLLRCDSQANWLEVFDGTDTIAGALGAPVALASAPGGRTLVLERDSCQVQVLVRDQTAPITTLGGVPTQRVQSATISFSATDAGSGVAATYARLDGGVTQTVTAPLVVSAEGTHTLDYWSVDILGNTEASRRATFAVDLTPPSGSFTFANGSAVSSTTAVGLKSAVADAVAMRVGVATQWGQWGPYAETTQVVLPALDATYTVRMDYRDIAGNVLSTTRDILLDRVGPSISGLRSASHPSTEPVWGPISVGWDTAADITGIVGYSATVDADQYGVPPMRVGSTVPSATLASPVITGTWYVHVRALDGAGNWGPISTISGVTLQDTQPPVTTVSGVPTATVNSTVTVSLVATDAISGVAGIKYSFDKGVTWIDYSGSIPKSAEATYTLWFHAVDNAGNTEVTQKVTFTIDRTGPTVGEIWFTPGQASVRASWTCEPDVSGIAGYAVRIDQSPTGDPGAVTQVLPSRQFEPTGSGWYAHVRALDNAGNWGPVKHRRYDRIRSILSRPAAVGQMRTHRQIVLEVSGRVTGDVAASGASPETTGTVTIYVERLEAGKWARVREVTATVQPTGLTGEASATYNSKRIAFRPLSARWGKPEVLRVRVLYQGNRDYLRCVSRYVRVDTTR